MATYPIKMLKDEENKPFVPLVSTDCIRDKNNQTLQQILNKKLSPDNLLGGDYVNITTEGNNCYVNVDLPASLNVINNLITSSAGQGALDAYQGKVLKDSIPQVVNDLSSTSTDSALSANQGYVLNQKFGDYVLTAALENLVKQYILASHPIGSIEINITGTNPGTYLGGTWIAWGSGKVPVGINTDDTDFATAEKTGGSKNHSHTISHTHGVPGVQHYHTLSENGWSNLVMHGSGYMCYRERTTPAWTPNFSTLTTKQDSGHPSENYGATLGGTTDNATPSATTTNSQSTTDSGGASTLQPYITCYMWKRT